MSLRKVPSLSLNDFLSSDKKTKDKFIKDLHNSFKEYGFVVLKNHIIDSKFIDEAYAVQKKLFDLDIEIKKKYILPGSGGARGYTPFGTEHAKGNPAKDLKEFWHIGRDLKPYDNDYKEYAPNIWVKELPEFKDEFLKIYSELEKVGDIVLEALEPSMGVEKGFFKKMTHNGNSILRLLHYPPIPEGEDPNCVRASAHSDINLITCLISGTTNGLELLDKNGKWIPVDCDHNNIVVNVGDMLSRICNDYLPSTVHRVVNPAKEKNISRLSMPFFLHPRKEALLSCLPKYGKPNSKYPDITSDDFLMERLRDIGLKK